MPRTEEVEQQLDYVELALALAEEECTKCLHPYRTESRPCSLCSIGVVRKHLQEAHNELIQIASL